MKFKSRINKENLNSLHGVIVALQRVGEKAVLFLSEDKIRIAVINENIDSPKTYSELVTNVLFSDYNIQSLSSNFILIELELEHFSKALASGKNAPQCQLKLVKRNSCPFLCFETKSITTLTMDVSHDIPIRIHRSDDINYYLPPAVPSPNVALELPRGKLMKVVLEKMCKLSKNVYITAHQSGRLNFRVDDTSATINTFFNHLQPDWGVLDQIEDIQNKATVKVDIRKISSVLNIHSLAWDNAYLCKYIILITVHIFINLY
jgi:hypothetical protein